MEPSKKQREAIEYLTDDKTDFIGYGGAAFGGKSYLLSRWITTMCLAYPDTGWGIGRKELTTLKKTTLLTLFKVFKEMKIKKDRDFTFNGQLNVLTFTNDSQIFLIDMAYKPADPLYTRFGGYELTGAGVDESAELEYKSIEILFTRLGRRNNKKYGLRRKLLETFNPAKNHVYSRYWKPFKENNMPERRAFIKALPKDNPSPEVDDYIQGIIDNADTVTIERLINGNFDYDDDPTALIEYDAIVDLFNNDFISPGTDKYITADIATRGSDKFVICVWFDLVVIALREYPKTTGKEVIDIIKELQSEYGVRASNIVFDADGIGGFIAGSDDSKKAFIPGAKEFINNSSPKLKENYENLKTQCYYRLAKYVNDGKIWLKSKLPSDTQEAIKEELQQVKTRDSDKDGKLKIVRKEDVKKNIGRSPDYADALMMRMYFELIPKRKKDWFV